jgi:hypothetical protein
MPATARCKPPRSISVGDYVLDGFEIELGADETDLTFRLLLGQGLGIYWALPASRNGRLRLAHVDGAAYDLPEPELVADPWCCDVPLLEWDGELGQLGNGRTLVGIRFEATLQPATYRCELITRRDGTNALVTRFAWRADDPWHLADGMTRSTLLDTQIARAASSDQVDIGAIAFIHEQGGRLFDEGFLDGSQYAAVHDLFSAARSADIPALRPALERCRTWSPPPPAPPTVSLVAGPVATGHRGPIIQPAFAPDSKRFVACDAKGLLAIHERHGSEFRISTRCTIEPARVSSRGKEGGIAWSPGGGRIAVHELRGVRVRDARDLSELALANVGDSTLAFGGDGAWLAVLGARGLTILAMPELAPYHMELAGSGDAMAVDPLGDIAVFVDGGATDETAMGAITHSEPTEIVVLRVGTRTVTRISPEGPVRGVVFDPWRQRVIAYRFGGEIDVWTLDGALERRFAPSSRGVCALAVTERWLVIIPEREIGEAVLELWTLDGTERVASAPIPGGLAPSWVVASPDGRMLLTRELPVRGEFGIRTWTIDVT